VSFASPPVLIGLIALPVLAAVYLVEQRRRARVASAFVSAPLLESVAPRRPGWRRHVPYALLAAGIAALILAAAKPQRTIEKPVKGATVMLVNDVSASMTATDVRPSRLAAAKRAANSFLARATGSTQVGSIEFARHPVLLQSPTTDHALTRAAIAGIKPEGGGTAMGGALELALASIRTAPKLSHKRPPGSVILISDGAANVGTNPVTVATAAKHAHVRIFTVSVGTARGVAEIPHRNGEVRTQVPVDPTELRQIAAASGAQAYLASDTAAVSAIYSHLASVLGHRPAEQGLNGYFAGAGLMLVALAAGLSLAWFARLT
jgi:Ca-activated chloride channel family protein